jgi:hypothetical protein
MMIHRCIATTAAILLLAAGSAEARGSKSGGGGLGGSRSSLSHSSRPIIGWGRGTCKSSACFEHHPTGSFMRPVTPKKRTM